MLLLNGKYLQNLHTSLLPAQPQNTECYRHDEEERAFNRTSNRWTVGILIAIVVVGGLLLTWGISTLPY